MNYNFSRRLMAVAGLVKSGHLILEDKARKVCFDVQMVLCLIYKHENKMNMTRLQEITPVNSARKSREGRRAFSPSALYCSATAVALALNPGYREIITQPNITKRNHKYPYWRMCNKGFCKGIQIIGQPSEDWLDRGGEFKLLKDGFPVDKFVDGVFGIWIIARHCRYHQRLIFVITHWEVL